MEVIKMEDEMKTEDEQTEEEMSTDELAESNHIMLNALIDLLVEKGVFTEGEFDKKLEEYEEDDDEEDEGENDDGSDEGAGAENPERAQSE
ncbi:MAG TPA: hypothetical protein ENF94_00340 [Candidatus Woesearchaeota archaeon]|nr:MAG: hypothetical protein DRJ25_03040 [Candidatus Woesearchaeota archaeon]HDD70587.1 hypothetical protein [Candidatus Woesearchaeota archaeon]